MIFQIGGNTSQKFVEGASHSTDDESHGVVDSIVDSIPPPTAL